MKKEIETTRIYGNGFFHISVMDFVLWVSRDWELLFATKTFKKVTSESDEVFLWCKAI